ncbi:MAG: DUF3570 domain-containing protein, partial [Betaproteobacteria bacterium]
MESKRQNLSQGALHALTAAALALPGLMPSAARAAEDNAVEVQFGQFQDNNRELNGLKSKFKPLEADSLQGSARFNLTDRIKGTIRFQQDTWSGATPIATAPTEWRGNRTRATDGVSGATPYLVSGSDLFLDKKTLWPLRTDGFGNLTGGLDDQLVHTLSGASRETRKQLDFSLTREWNEWALDVGGGTSVENDYESRFGSIGGRFDFNQKRTTVALGASYTSNDSKAILDHDATPYIFNTCGTAKCNFVSATSYIEDLPGGKKVLHGDRTDWGVVAGLTQVLNQNVQLNTTLGYTHSDGYLANPYKVVEVAFIDPAQQFLAPNSSAVFVNVNSLLEQRPDTRNQWVWNIRYAHFIEAADAALHLNYAHFRDDWGIRSHTLDAEWAQPVGNGWTITPRIRYYTQSAATFYTPYLVTDQGQFSTGTDPVTGRAVVVPFDRTKLPTHYSSDYRLSGYGALGTGVTISKTLSKGLTFKLGYEYYRHAGNLKWGGNGEGAYADFNFHLVNASLKFDLDAADKGMAGMSHGAGVDHSMHNMAEHEHGKAPAGVMFGHMLSNAGDSMVGVRYMNSQQAGGMIFGSSHIDDARLKANGCGAAGCQTAPTGMKMNMYMIDLMYAPTDWLTLMVMPQYMDMSMSMRGLLSTAEQAKLPPDVRSMYDHHTMHAHTSGGIGDTGLYASFKLLDRALHQVQATLGVTAPTGDVSVKFRDTHQIVAGFQDYGMQLGSGTWDFNPSVTYTGTTDKWSWGAQLSGTIRMESSNKSGYALGDMGQATAWAGYQLLPRLSASVRGIYTQQRAIKGEFNGKIYKLSAADYPANYGGRFVDVGAGINYDLAGTWAGNQISVEWVQPLKDDFNGYQLERRGTLYANWQY